MLNSFKLLRRGKHPKRKTRKAAYLAQYLSLILLSLSFFACRITFFEDQSLGDSSIISPPTPAPILKAEIFFWVEIPDNTPGIENLQLVILDEVTGLPFNQERHDMLKIDSTHFGIAIQTRVGSVIKYRYERINGSYIQEYSGDGDPIRYRLYLAEGPGEVHDIVTRWSDSPPLLASGRIIGNVIDKTTNQPIPDILIFAGGSWALTASDGSFIISPLQVGQHNLVAYSLDGQYLIHQQQVQLASESATPVHLALQPSVLTDVTFVVTVPENTPEGFPIRLSGNLFQLGNTFTNLSNETSGMVTRMPQLTPIGDGRYSITLKLPAEVDIRYKYTIGDGFWNAEHNSDYSFITRQLILPGNGQPQLVEDTVSTWQTIASPPIWFKVSVPTNTPTGGHIYIQFKLGSWMAPIPMWPLDTNTWIYQLQSPLNIGEELTYRYCRRGQCGEFVDYGTEILIDGERKVSLINDESILINDVVPGWKYFSDQPTPAIISGDEIYPRDPEFIMGIALYPGYVSSWEQLMQNTLITIKSLNANLVVFSPTWTSTKNQPPTFFKPLLGENTSFFEISQNIRFAKNLGLRVALFPQINFPNGGEETWWRSIVPDEVWWQVWFERYRTFLIHHAILAEKTGADSLILGGDWLIPALPGSNKYTHITATFPGNIDDLWSNLIKDIRQNYSGSIGWYLNYDQLAQLPAFINEVDQIYLQIGAPLGNSSNASMHEIKSRAELILDNKVKELQETLQKPIILSLAFPSADGGVTNCLKSENPEIYCLPMEFLSPLNPDNTTINLDLQEQVDLYNGFLAAVNERQWVSGIISEGFFPPIGLEDKSTSIHGKPALEIVRYWFSHFLGK